MAYCSSEVTGGVLHFYTSCSHFSLRLGLLEVMGNLVSVFFDLLYFKFGGFMDTVKIFFLESDGSFLGKQGPLSIKAQL